MVKPESSANKYWVALYYLGQFIILIVTITIFVDLPLQSQPLLAIASALAWFVSSFLFFKSPHKTKTNKNSHVRFLLIGVAETVFAILFLTIIKPRTEIAKWASITNMMFGIPSFLIASVALVSHFFPNLIQSISTPPPNPLAEFPSATQEIINKGRFWVNIPPGITVGVFFIIAVIGNTISVIKFHDESSRFSFVVLGAGFLIAFTLSIIATFKWQKWALQSGIPKEELKAAAKRVGLWWPKIKEE